MTEPAPPSPALLQIGRRPDEPDIAGPAGGAGPADDGQGSWVTLPDIGPPSSQSHCGVLKMLMKIMFITVSGGLS